MSDERKDLIDWIAKRYRPQMTRYRYWKLRRRLKKTAVELLREIKEDLSAADTFLQTEAEPK